jgi:hypothetical protein
MPSHVMKNLNEVMDSVAADIGASIDESYGLNVNNTTVVASSDADRLLQLNASIELSAMEQRELRAKFVALLPVATEEQFSVLKACVAAESAVPEGNRVGQDFKLSPEQEQILRDTREERRKHCMENKDLYVSAIAADVDQKLVSMKVRIGTKKTVTNLRFEKAQGGGGKGLLAQLRAKAGL